MNTKLILIAPCLAMLAACGGSSDGSAANPVQSPPNTTAPTQVTESVLQTFGDGAGVARATITESGETYVINLMAPDIQSNSGDASAVFDPNGIYFVQSNNYGDFYAGRTTVNGTLIDVIIYEDNSQDVAAVYAESSGANVLGALGPEVSNIPSGSYTYAGTNIIGFRDGSYSEDGTFAMNVNFTSKAAQLTGSTASSTIGGSGISINTSDGTFTGNNLTLTESSSGLSTTATIHGNFHGSGATGVTGLYSDNASTPTIAGVIVGTR
jgi:hypothetical protein